MIIGKSYTPYFSSHARQSNKVCRLAWCMEASEVYGGWGTREDNARREPQILLKFLLEFGSRGGFWWWREVVFFEFDEEHLSFLKKHNLELQEHKNLREKVYYKGGGAFGVRKQVKWGALLIANAWLSLFLFGRLSLLPNLSKICSIKSHDLMCSSK